MTTLTGTDSSHGPQRQAARRKRVLVPLVALTLTVIAIIALLFVSAEGSTTWATTVDELVENAAMRDQRVRVQGTLVKGSLQKRDNPCAFRFQLEGQHAVIQVQLAKCVIPDSLQDRPEARVSVTAEGRLGGDGVFEASRVLAKCPSKYEQQGEKMVPVGELELR